MRPEMDDNNGFSSNINIGSMNGFGKQGLEDSVYSTRHRENNVQYSMPGILHFLQTEWAKLEMQKSQWEIERAELQARIAFLQGERRGQENLKQDLVRRIKMLEYALKQERVKYSQLKSSHQGSGVGAAGSGEYPADSAGAAAPDFEETGLDPAQKLAVDTQRAATANVQWRESRQRLRQFLQEVGYTDNILDVRQARVRRVMTEDPRMVSSAVGGSNSSSVEPSSRVVVGGGDDRRGLGRSLDGRGERPNGGVSRQVEEAMMDSEAASIMQTFDFLTEEQDDNEEEPEKADQSDKSEPSVMTNDLSDEFLQSLDTDMGKGMRFGRKAGKRSTLKAMLASLEEDCKDLDSSGGSGGASGPIVELSASSGAVGPRGSSPRLGAKGVEPAEERAGRRDDLDGFGGPLGLGDLATLTVANEAEPQGPVAGGSDHIEGGLGPRVESGESSALDAAGNVASGAAERKSWTPRFTLRGHLDAVRAVAFHPTERTLFTGSEDSTINVWNIGKANQGKKLASVDVEASHTLRGHEGAVLCLSACTLDEGKTLFSGGLDGTVRMWRVPPLNTDPYEAYDAMENGPVLTGHTNAVWSLSLHPTRPALISGSADGTVRLWDVDSESDDNGPQLKRTWDLAGLLSEEDVRATGVTILAADPGQCLVSVSQGSLVLLDIETGQMVSSATAYHDDVLDSSPAPANCMVGHPALPMAITGHDDKRLRFLDLRTGTFSHSMVAHLDAVTGLALDTYGLYLASASHDSSIRLWNVDSKTCVQEVTSHRKKFEEAVFSVAFHPKMPYMASGGADAIAKVYV